MFSICSLTGYRHGSARLLCGESSVNNTRRGVCGERKSTAAPGLPGFAWSLSAPGSSVVEGVISQTEDVGAELEAFNHGGQR